MTQTPLEFGAQPDLSPDEEIMVALDLETTGLDAHSDRIIEVGAIKFRGGEEIDTYSTLVNPMRPLSRFIVGLTGISQEDVDAAPLWDEVVGDVAAFIGTHPMVGHRVGFDAGFLKSHNAPAKGPLYDTYELAAVLLPGSPDYSLGGLSSRFKFRHDDPHRALSDALATRDIFSLLVGRLLELDPAILRQFERLGEGTDWTVAALASRILQSLPAERRRSLLAPPGVDRKALSDRLRVHATQSGTIVNPSAMDHIGDVFAPGGVLSQHLPEYEHRREQVLMSEAVTVAMQDGKNLIVEAGTGVGKSLAYLVPAALRALSGGGPVIISTNTINLQEQLINKDLPAVETVLETMGIPRGTLRSTQLKGRSNYLCFKRWTHAQSIAIGDMETARVLGKTLHWLQTTETGDRGELTLPRAEGGIFSRLSAQGAVGCPAQEGPCFLRRARFAAQTAHIIIVNHALLMSDVVMGGGLLPDHSALVIDEAHHLEDVATRHLGFSVNQGQFEADIAALEGERGVLADAIRSLSALASDAPQRDRLVETANNTQAEVRRARQAIGDFYDLLSTVSAGLRGGSTHELRITGATRAQPAWSNLEIAWENMDLATSSVEAGLKGLYDGMVRALPDGNDEAEAAQLNTAAAIESIETTRSSLRQAITEPEEGRIYWLTSYRNDAVTIVNGAPLRVGPILQEELFARERSVILTSGTLSEGDNFDRLRTAVGVPAAGELLLGSPFDFKRAALVTISDDLPEPNQPGYPAAVAKAISDIALATRDRMLVLFTSNSALQTAREALKDSLGAEGINVIGQGPDGTPHRIMRTLEEKQQTVALGSGSLWEGIDLEGASIKTLMVARLPFPVPSEPVFEARSEQYEDSFSEYAVPEAVMRFRQGFGRLIRSRSDKGAFVILDSRVETKGYGQRFIRALGDCRIERVPSAALGARVKDWLSW